MSGAEVEDLGWQTEGKLQDRPGRASIEELVFKMQARLLKSGMIDTPRQGQTGETPTH